MRNADRRDNCIWLLTFAFSGFIVFVLALSLDIHWLGGVYLALQCCAAVFYWKEENRQLNAIFENRDY